MKKRNPKVGGLSRLDAVESELAALSTAFAAHTENPQAHGVRHDVGGRAVAWVAALSGFSGVIGALVHHHFTR